MEAERGGGGLESGAVIRSVSLRNDVENRQQERWEVGVEPRSGWLDVDGPLIPDPREHDRKARLLGGKRDRRQHVGAVHHTVPLFPHLVLDPLLLEPEQAVSAPDVTSRMWILGHGTV